MSSRIGSVRIGFFVAAIAVTAALLLPAAGVSGPRTSAACDNRFVGGVAVEGLKVTITAGVIARDGDGLKHVYDWGDGSAASELVLVAVTGSTVRGSVEHTYARGGTYTISSTVTAFTGVFNNCDQATVAGTKTVTLNRPPIAENDASRVLAGKTLKLNVLANDSDPDGDTITATNWQLKEPGEASYGPLTSRFRASADGTLTFRAPKAEVGTWLLTYQARDPWTSSPSRAASSSTGQTVSSADSKLARVTLSTGCPKNGSVSSSSAGSPIGASTGYNGPQYTAADGTKRCSSYGWKLLAINCQPTLGGKVVTGAPNVWVGEFGKTRIERFKLQARMRPNAAGIALRDWKTVQSANVGNTEADNARTLAVKTDTFTPEKDFDIEVKIIFERPRPRTDIVKKFRWAFDETTCPETS